MSEWNNDLEIYLKDADATAIGQWLQASFDAAEEQPAKGNTRCWQVREGEHWLEVRIVPGAAGKRFTCVWFKQRPARWPADVDAARAAFAALGGDVRCVAEGWQEGDDPDQWWRINAKGEGLMVWAE